MEKNFEKKYVLEEVGEVVKAFLDFVNGVDAPDGRAQVVGLVGNLGAGKTTFVKEVLKQLGYTGSVASPTFVLRRDYELENRKIIHIDAYRLETPSNIWQVISKEELADKKNLFLIEWGDLIDQNLLDLVFEFTHIDENTRSIYLKQNLQK